MATTVPTIHLDCPSCHSKNTQLMEDGPAALYYWHCSDCQHNYSFSEHAYRSAIDVFGTLGRVGVSLSDEQRATIQEYAATGNLGAIQEEITKTLEKGGDTSGSTAKQRNA